MDNYDYITTKINALKKNYPSLRVRRIQFNGQLLK